ncbi:hypothetical protein [Rhizobium leguminosarum]|uniref:hypothetical protein n=1 Tax=Rhizobium leguminosarum TaxID=384 RepID=UPI0011AE4627|nr:hypothetical protein [Rhizobium leguminosarum]
MSKSWLRKPIIIIPATSIACSFVLISYIDTIIGYITSLFGISYQVANNGFSSVAIVSVFIAIAMISFYFVSFNYKIDSQDTYENYHAPNNADEYERINVQVSNNLNVRIKILEARSLLIYWTMIFVIASGVLLILSLAIYRRLTVTQQT